MNELHVRCDWANGDELMAAYHDGEWGVPLHDDRALFELLTLEGAQAGLSWQTVLNKRQGYRDAFHNFDIERVAQMDAGDVERLMLNPGIIRNRAKIISTIRNARLVLAVQREFGSFDAFLWQFVQGRPIVTRPKSLADIAAKSPESDILSKALLKRGFKFVGSTICYAFMQATGMVDDHVEGCFRSTARAGGD